jgi:hypothetical protein
MRELDRAVVYSNHARTKMADRGVSEDDVVLAIRGGRREPARHGHWQYRINLEFRRERAGKYYGMRQVLAVVAEEESRYVVVTVYAFYFQEGQER